VARERGVTPVSEPENVDDVNPGPGDAVEPTEPTTAGVAAGPRRTPLIVVSAALAVALVALVGVVIWQVASRHSNSHQSAVAASQAGYLAGPAAIAAETAASNDTRATLTYSYKNLAANFATAEKGLTPAFSASYRTTTAQKVTPLAKKYKATSTAVVSDAGVSAVSTNSATVLLFVDQTVENSQLAHPRLDRSRIKVSMVNQSGRWLVSNLSPI
jgi:Mce-associated membrane protein